MVALPTGPTHDEHCESSVIEEPCESFEFSRMRRRVATAGAGAAAVADSIATKADVVTVTLDACFTSGAVRIGSPQAVLEDRENDVRCFHACRTGTS